MKEKNCIFISLLLLIITGCATTTEKENLFVLPHEITLRYPVVLVHGVGRNDTTKTSNPWGRIPDILRNNGVEVFFGNTDAWGDIESNAEQLKKTIDSILEETKKTRVNIIAHSKGGLDSRFLIWNYNYGDKIASLTTIGTPHQGSEVADLIFSSQFIHSNAAKRNLKRFGNLFGDEAPNPYKVNYQLTTIFMEEFNYEVIMDKRVYFQSIYTQMEHHRDDPKLAISHRYIKRVYGENDGLVNVDSARWGGNEVKMWGSVSHEQIIDQGTKKEVAILVPVLYLNIVNELSKMAF